MKNKRILSAVMAVAMLSTTNVAPAVYADSGVPETTTTVTEPTDVVTTTTTGAVTTTTAKPVTTTTTKAAATTTTTTVKPVATTTTTTGKPVVTTVTTVATKPVSGEATSTTSVKPVSTTSTTTTTVASTTTTTTTTAPSVPVINDGKKVEVVDNIEINTYAKRWSEAEGGGDILDTKDSETYPREVWRIVLSDGNDVIGSYYCDDTTGDTAKFVQNADGSRTFRYKFEGKWNDIYCGHGQDFKYEVIPETWDEMVISKKTIMEYNLGDLAWRSKEVHPDLDFYPETNFDREVPLYDTKFARDKIIAMKEFINYFEVDGKLVPYVLHMEVLADSTVIMSVSCEEMISSLVGKGIDVDFGSLLFRKEYNPKAVKDDLYNDENAYMFGSTGVEKAYTHIDALHTDAHNIKFTALRRPVYDIEALNQEFYNNFEYIPSTNQFVMVVKPLRDEMKLRISGDSFYVHFGGATYKIECGADMLTLKGTRYAEITEMTPSAVAVSYTRPENWYVRGDLNADGKFNISDAVLLQKWILGTNPVIANWKAGDYDLDGCLDVFDLCRMKQELISKDTK